MNTKPRSKHIAAGTIAALALLAGACGDPASKVSSPSFSNSASAATSSYTVLANAAVTCTDGSIIGDVGTNLATPTGSVTLTTCPVTGTVHVGDASATRAFNNFLGAYAALAPKPGDVCTTLTGTLAGVTLAPGTYCFDAAATLTGTLTLDGPANASWVFKIGTLGTGALTGTNFQVVMTGGAEPCNVIWWVAEAATMTTSDFQGTILAGAAITLTGGTFNGNVFAKADVTITGTAVTGCDGGISGGVARGKCNQGVGNGPEACDPGNSNHHNTSNDELGGTPGNPGRKTSN
jgi:hypothetical protein